MRTARLIMVLLLTTAILTGCAAQRLIKRGDASMLANRPVDAAAYYEQALAKKPKLAEKGEFVAKFTQAKDAASVVHHRQALAAADGGDLDTAIARLRRSLEMDPTNADAREALDSTGPAASVSRGESQALYQEALALQAQRRWRQAADGLRRAIAAKVNHVPSRVELHRSEQELAQSRSAYTQGVQHLDRRELDRAIVDLQRSLDIWPFHNQATEALQQARTRRAEAEQLYSQAGQLAAQDQWDDAIGAGRRALAVFPHHGGAKSLIRETRQRAAAAHVATGDRLLDERRLDDARGAFLKALQYVAGMTDARKGLARVDIILGEAAAARGLPGNALLWYTSAAEHIRWRESADRVAQMRAVLARRIGFPVSLEVTRAAQGPVAGYAALNSGVPARFAQRSPGFVTLARGEGVAYSVEVELVRSEVRGGAVRSESRTHHYTVGREVSNPEIPQLAHQLQVAEMRLARMHRIYHSSRQGGHSSGIRSVRNPGGRGSGRRSVASPVARVHVSNPRSRDHRPGARVTATDIHRQEREVRNLHRRLARTPATVVHYESAVWPYTVRHYEMLGTMEATLVVRDAAGAVVFTDGAGEHVEYRDSTIENAHPEIGLAFDGLELPSQLEVERVLVDSLSRQLADKAIGAVIQVRIAAAQAAASRLSGEGRAAEAIEAEVEAAMLLEALDPRQASRELQRLRLSLRGRVGG